MRRESEGGNKKACRDRRSVETIKDGENDGEGRMRRVEGESSYFNIKRHGEAFNVPFTAPFACL